MREEDWKLLLSRVSRGDCTPFLGAGACAGTLPLGGELAERWATEHRYPLDDVNDLARVSQFLGVRSSDSLYPKELISSELEHLRPPDFARQDEPHAVLAQLPLRVYMTTNYDDYMFAALRRFGKNPIREICRWNTALASYPTVLDASFVPTPTNPVVYHLHGHLSNPESIVLTEDDYLDFLIAISRDENLLPHQIRRALAGASLLFVGYGLADWDFRVLHRGLVMAGEKSLRRLSVTVQLDREDPAREYLDMYFSQMNVRVFWGTADTFMAELGRRWREFSLHG